MKDYKRILRILLSDIREESIAGLPLDTDEMAARFKQSELTTQAKLKKEEESGEQEDRVDAIDATQKAADYITTAAGAVPGLNYAASGIDTLSAGIDVNQGQFGNAAARTTNAGLNLIPGAKLAVLATKTGVKSAVNLVGKGSVDALSSLAGGALTAVTPHVTRTLPVVAKKIADSVAGNVAIRVSNKAANDTIKPAIDHAVSNIERLPVIPSSGIGGGSRHVVM